NPSPLAPLALSRFLRRATVGACKNRSAAPGCGALLLLRASPRPRKRQTAAPAPPRLFRPLDAARLRSQPRLRCFVHWTRSARLSGQKRKPPHASRRGRTAAFAVQKDKEKERMPVQAGRRPYSPVQSAIRAARAGVRAAVSRRQRQFPLWVLGVLIRASGPRCSQSAMGITARSDTLARQAQIMASVRPAGSQRR